MKSIIGVGNALTDILAVLPDDELIRRFHLPVGSMQHVDEETGEEIWNVLREKGVQFVSGGSAANTIGGTSVFGMKSAFIGKVGDDELGSLFRTSQENLGIESILFKGTLATGRAMVFVRSDTGERTFATYLGSAIQLEPDELKGEFFIGYDYCYIEGYLVQNQDLLRKATELAKMAGCTVVLDLASYNVVESNNAFLHDIIENYVDILFANEKEAEYFTGKSTEEALEDMASICDIAVVKMGERGSIIRRGNKVYKIKACPAHAIDATGAGDIYASGFIYAHSLGMPLDICGRVGSIISGKVVEVVGPKVDIPRWKTAKAEIRNLMGLAV
ncbi:MAG: adenosine kinase [Bacteroidales bacterium]|jgi:sugar/nucleoside kinase (ribokinase family)|nr:adenosine kinase [Bacteroidales bacterium]